MGFDYDLFMNKKDKKRAILENNREKGRVSEEISEMKETLRGHHVEKIHEGGDQVIDGKTVKEIKNPGAKLTPAQKKMKKKMGENYEVEEIASPFHY